MGNLAVQIERHVGGAGVVAIGDLVDVHEGQIRKVVRYSISAILSGLGDKCATHTGAAAVHRRVLAADDTLLDRVPRFLHSPVAIPKGADVLNDIFGARQDVVLDAISSTSGVGRSDCGPVTAVCAPIVLAYLARLCKAHDLTQYELSALLAQQRHHLPHALAAAFERPRVTVAESRRAVPFDKRVMGVVGVVGIPLMISLLWGVWYVGDRMSASDEIERIPVVYKTVSTAGPAAEPGPAGGLAALSSVGVKMAGGGVRIPVDANELFTGGVRRSGGPGHTRELLVGGALREGNAARVRIAADVAASENFDVVLKGPEDRVLMLRTLFENRGVAGERISSEPSSVVDILVIDPKADLSAPVQLPQVDGSQPPSTPGQK